MKFYKLAVKDILDQCGQRLHTEGEFSEEHLAKLNGQAPKKFNRLYDIYGNQIKSLLMVNEDVSFLVAGKKTEPFQGLRTNNLFSNAEDAHQFVNRLVNKSDV